MTNKQHPAQFDWATELLDAQGHVTLSVKEAHEIGARLRSMGEKLKAYEDLDEAASDVQLLRMGYAAARLEIESLQARIKTMAEERADELTVAHLDGRMRAAQPAGAQQPGAAYAALPDECDSPEICAISKTCAGQFWTKRICASHGQAPAQAAPAAVALPEGWVPLVITHEGQYPEEIAYGPQRMMDRLDRWLRKYFDFVAAAKEQPAPAPDLQEDQTQPWYDIAWKHGARRHTSFDGDELTELSFRPAQFDAFCAELAPAAGAVAPVYKDSTPELHVGDSAFESWYSAYSPAHKNDKQRARDAYAAGMGDPLVMAAPAAVAWPRVTDAMALAFHSALSDGAIGSDEVEETKAGLRAALAAAPTTQPAPTPSPSPASQGDALDAARCRWLRDCNLAKFPEINSAFYLGNKNLDTAIDAASAAQGGRDVALFTTPAQRGEVAGDGNPCNNDHDPDCRWPDCLCRHREAQFDAARKQGANHD